MGDNVLSDVKGGTVVDENHSEHGNIFIDAGDGASKTDMANTLGHEVIETQNLQGKDSSLTGGLLGENSTHQQEDLANAFGEQFADRINQAAGGDLDASGGKDFANNLKDSDSVKAGTQRANNVGGATVDHRQLSTKEGNWLKSQTARYAKEKGISEEQAKRDLTQAALRSTDKAHNYNIKETDGNVDALGWLSEQAGDDSNMPSELASLVRAENDIDGDISQADKANLRENSGYYDREQNSETRQDKDLNPLYSSALGNDANKTPTEAMRGNRAAEVCETGNCLSPTASGAIGGVLNETVLMGIIDADTIDDPEVREAFDTASDITEKVVLATGTAGAVKTVGTGIVKNAGDIVDVVQGNADNIDANAIRQATEEFGKKNDISIQTPLNPKEQKLAKQSELQGGAHRDTTKPANDGMDSHHMPDRNADPSVSANDGPAIKMAPEDHAATSSNGNKGLEGKMYRAETAQMIENGQYRDAMASGPCGK